MSTTQRAARHLFALLAVLVAAMGFYNLANGTIGLAVSVPGAWQAAVVGVIYMVSAIGLLLRPRWFVLFFGVVTIYTLAAGAINLWRAATGGTSLLSLQLMAGLIVFPLALNLLTADTMHELMEDAIGR